MGARQRWSYGWQYLFDDVVGAGRCTGCSGCIIACPHDVLDLDRATWKPLLAEEAWVDVDPSQCEHALRGCTLCTRACPRFLDWQEAADLAKWERRRTEDEILGVNRGVFMVSATDEAIAAAGQDGGVGTAVLAYAMERDIIDAALVSNFDAEQRPTPGVARNREELLAAAGSRYTYSPNTLAYPDALEAGAERIGLVSVGCQTTIPTIASTRGARKLAKRFALVIGLLCSVTFDESIFPDLLEARYGLARGRISKVNIKGKLQVWQDGKDGPPSLEIPLKECHEFRREGCSTCPDFTAEYADLSLGGIGKVGAKTLTIVRTDLGEQLLHDMESDGWLAVEDASEVDPDAVALVGKLATRQRKRWPTDVPPEGDREPAPVV